MASPSIGIDRPTFRRLAMQMRRRWGVTLLAANPDGGIVMPAGRTGRSLQDERRLAIHETLRWGEPTVQFAKGGKLPWAMPLMHNARLLGLPDATACEAAS